MKIEINIPEIEEAELIDILKTIEDWSDEWFVALTYSVEDVEGIAFEPEDDLSPMKLLEESKTQDESCSYQNLL